MKATDVARQIVDRIIASFDGGIENEWNMMDDYGAGSNQEECDRDECRQRWIEITRESLLEHSGRIYDDE